MTFYPTPTAMPKVGPGIDEADKWGKHVETFWSSSALDPLALCVRSLSANRCRLGIPGWLASRLLRLKIGKDLRTTATARGPTLWRIGTCNSCI